jgi:hypothetical protein
MSHDRPFYRVYRPLVRSNNSGWSARQFVRDPRYALQPNSFVRGLVGLERDLAEVFDFVEPAERNAKTYGYRLHQLLLRCCVEVEANFKAILLANKFDAAGSRLDMRAYSRVETSHHLSSYRVILPMWDGDGRSFYPFQDWANRRRLSWYEAYNAAKHDRHTALSEATLENLVYAVGGLFVLLTAQFGSEDYSGKPDALGMSSELYEGSDGVSSLFRVEYPSDWTTQEMYDFDWHTLASTEAPFAKFDYDAVPEIAILK